MKLTFFLTPKLPETGGFLRTLGYGQIEDCWLIWLYYRWAGEIGKPRVPFKIQSAHMLSLLSMQLCGF